MAKATTLPDELVSAISERRLIPFVGAGFSASVGFPQWHALLRVVASKIEDCMTYEEIAEYANDDPLRIAEYLYLRAHKSIGPVRHAISQELPTIGTTSSPSHVELINLGAPQVYTTNYDDLIEDTYRSLGLDVSVVRLPRDVATASPDSTQVVKYHGDLRHDDTLVLTESSYYRRLDFESPIDVKFRSDLLGKSVLFLGYSFRDINIRVIWYKLMRVMADIPPEDRMPSYIVRLDVNPVLEELDRAVGLRTIVLDPENSAETQMERGELLAQFLSRLATAASPGGTINGTSNPLFLSSMTLTHLANRIESLKGRRGMGRTTMLPLRPQLRMLLDRAVPSSLIDQYRALLEEVLEFEVHERLISQVAVHYSRQFGESDALTYFASFGISRPGTREELLSAELDWSILWSGQLSSDRARRRIRNLAQEAEFGYGDPDFAYLVDVVKRITGGEIFDHESDDAEEVLALAHAALAPVEERFETARAYEPTQGSPPDVEAMIEEASEAWGSEDSDEERVVSDEDVW